MKPVIQQTLFDQRPYVGSKVTAEQHRAWRDRNREHVRAMDRARSKRRTRTYMKQWRKKHRDKLIASERRKRLKKYGLTIADYDRMVIAQGGCCKICRRPPRNRKTVTGRKYFQLDVDHCHKTKRVRGLLCYNCNAILGHAKDNLDVLRAAIAYLEAAA